MSELPPYLQWLQDTIERDILSRADAGRLISIVAEAYRWEDPLFYLTHPKGIAVLNDLETSVRSTLGRSARVALRALIMWQMSPLDRAALIDKALAERRAVLDTLPKPEPVVLDLSKIKI